MAMFDHGPSRSPAAALRRSDRPGPGDRGAATVRVGADRDSQRQGRQRLAVLYSGDGGWGPLDQGVARQLADNGVPTLGVDSLRYFLIKRSPREAADDLSRLAAPLRSALEPAGHRAGGLFLRRGRPARDHPAPARRPARPCEERGADRDRPDRRPDLPPVQLVRPLRSRRLSGGAGDRGAEGTEDDLRLWRPGAPRHLRHPAGRSPRSACPAAITSTATMSAWARPLCGRRVRP
jgi:hypothetical protein